MIETEVFRITFIHNLRDKDSMSLRELVNLLQARKYQNVITPLV
jgi:hypothetical protein